MVHRYLTWLFACCLLLTLMPIPHVADASPMTMKRTYGTTKADETSALPVGWSPFTPAPSLNPVLLGYHRTEPDVAIDPRDPRLIVVATNPVYRFNALGQQPMGVFISHDGGRSWTARTAPMAPPFVIGSDPSVAFAADGTLFVAFEAVAGGFCSSASRTAVLVTRSTDGGASFTPPVIVDVNPSNDKPFMAVGPGPGGQGAAVYVAWIRFASGLSSQIAFSRSLDGGRTFSAPILLSSGAGIHVAPMPATGAAGDVSVAWLAGQALPENSPNPMREHMEIATSTDAGVHFGPVGRTLSFWGLPGLEQPGSMRLFNGPSLAIAGPRRLYLSWAQVHPMPPGVAGSPRADVVLSRSTDGGQHWSVPFALNDTIQGDRFEPQIAVGPAGLLVAIFYDRRRNGADLDLVSVVARDTGTRVEVGPNQMLTALPSPISAIPFIPPGSFCLAPGRFFGDYIGLVVGSGLAAAAWTTSTLVYPGETAVRFLSIPLTPAFATGVSRSW
jgi:hypothetical protein